MRKRGLAIFLIVCMLFTAFPVYAAPIRETPAEDETPVSPVTEDVKEEPASPVMEADKTEEEIPAKDEPGSEKASEENGNGETNENTQTQDADALEISEEEERDPLRSPSDPVDLDNLCIIGKTTDGKYYGLKTYGKEYDDVVGTKKFLTLTKEEYEKAAKNTFLIFKRADGQAFKYPDAKIADTDEWAETIFEEIQFKNHMAYRYTLVNFDPTRKVPGMENVMWSLELKKDWVIEGDPGFADGTQKSDYAYIHFHCELDGNGHKIYRNDKDDHILFLGKGITPAQGVDDPKITIRNLTVDGSKKYRGILVTNGSLVHLENVTVQNAYNATNGPSYGGAITLREDTTLTMDERCKIVNCTSEHRGGAMYVDKRTKVELNGAELSGNKAKLYGGAMFATQDSEITLHGVKMDSNTSDESGGAICATKVKALTVENGCSFSNNSAVKNGGAIYITDSTKLTVENDCTFSNNSAVKNGGAIYSTGSTPLTVKNQCAFSENKASGTGGAIYINKDTVAQLEDCTLSENTAKWGGAIGTFGDVAINKTQLDKNTASSQGGAIYVGKNVKNFGIQASNFKENQAQWGGALALKSKTEIKEGTNFEGNKADNLGGAIYLVQGELSVRNVDFVKNGAMVGGGIFITNDNASGVHISNSNFTENKSGQSIDNPDAFGGGIYLSRNSKLEIADSTFAKNEAYHGGAIATQIKGINPNQSMLKVTASTFEGNISCGGGGVMTAVPTKFTQCTFTGNRAEIHPLDDQTNPHDTGTGGAIYVINHKTLIQDCAFEKNWAYGSGGALEINGVTRDQGAEGKPITGLKEDIKVEISGKTVFRGNIAKVGQGGAIHTIPYQYVDPVNLQDPDPAWKKQAYKNISMTEEVVFEGNRAEAGFSRPPENWEDFADLKFQRNSFEGVEGVDEIFRQSLLNNYDVNYKNEPVEILYVGNGGTFNTGGTSTKTRTDEYPIDLTDGVNATVKITISDILPTRKGYTFKGWLGEDGKTYSPGTEMLVGGNKIFVAQWEKDSTPGGPIRYTITYDADGGKIDTAGSFGTASAGREIVYYTYAYGEVITIIGAPQREGYKFLYWKGSEYQPGDSYTVKEDHTFVAQWEKESEPQREEPHAKAPGGDLVIPKRIDPIFDALRQPIPIIPRAGVGQ